MLSIPRVTVNNPTPPSNEPMGIEAKPVEVFHYNKTHI